MATSEDRANENFQSKIEQQIERLKRYSSREIERQVAEKRIMWLKQNPNAITAHPHASPRDAFELLFFDYLGLNVDDLPVVSESATEIVWHSRNPCPTLEAAQRLGLDTQQICRACYEKSTQVFLSRLDPQLRFLRDYSEIRPHADHCKEMIVRVDFEAMMNLAIAKAKMAKDEGNPGYGAVVVLGNRILGQAHDTTITDSDPSHHAEVNAIRQAVAVLGDRNLSGAILFSTCEPCPMCSSLAVWANATTMIYGASIEETTRLRKTRIRVSAKEIVDKSPVMIQVIGGVLRNACLAVYN